jgi:hypothetical protein
MLSSVGISAKLELSFKLNTQKVKLVQLFKNNPQGRQLRER